MARLRFLLYSIIGLYCLDLLASESPDLNAMPPETTKQYFVRKNIAIADWFDGVADGIDLFLAEERYPRIKNKTSATAETSVYYNRAEGFSSAFSFNVDLRLPNFEQYWMLTFRSYDETQERKAQDRYLRRAPRERNLGATLGFFKKLGNIRTAFQPRIAFSATPAISHSLIFESLAEIQDHYWFNPKLEFYANPNKGAGTFQAINFNFQLSTLYSLTFVNEGDYEGRRQFYTVTHGVSLGQKVSAKKSLGYNVFISFINKPNYQLDGGNISVTWKHIVYQKILDYQVTPYVDFRQSRSYEGNPGITASINLIF